MSFPILWGVFISAKRFALENILQQKQGFVIGQIQVGPYPFAFIWFIVYTPEESGGGRVHCKV